MSRKKRIAGKRILAALVAVLMFLMMAAMMTGCGNDSSNNDDDDDDDRGSRTKDDGGSGGGDEQSPVGTWEHEDGSYVITLEFRRDGTGRWTEEYDGEVDDEFNIEWEVVSDTEIRVTAAGEGSIIAEWEAGSNQLELDGATFTRR